MNKKLFFAGFALLAAVSFTSCNSDNPIDVTDPNGVRPVNSAHYLGGSYDWTAVVKDYAQLQEFWAADKDAVKKALTDSKANKVNILLDVSNYELKNEVITLPNFWGAGADTNGKVVNITFQGNFKNADFERAHAIDKGDVIANMSKFPVRINTNTLERAEVNFTFNVAQFDLVLDTREARSTFSGSYTIGYMFANADRKVNDAVEVKEGTVEGLDVTSTGNYKGTIDGVWTKGANIDANSANGIQLVDERIKAKNVFVENSAIITNEYWANNKWNNYALGTVKFVNKNAETVDLMNGGINSAIEKIQGFDKGKCKVMLTDLKGLENIDAVEKVTIDTYMAGNTILAKDVFTDVTFDCDITFSTSDVNKFENVTFNRLYPYIAADGDVLTFNSVNFWRQVVMRSAIGVLEVAKTQSWTYQWIVDSTPNGGHFELVTNAAPLKEANKDKAVVEVDWFNFIWDDPTDPTLAGSRLFIRNPWTANNVNGNQVTALNKNYVVKVTRTWTVGTTYIPDGVKVVLDDKCKFSDNNVTGEGAQLSKTNYSLNYVWGAKDLYDEECWYDVNYAGVDYLWKKASWGMWGGAAKFVLTAPAAAE